MITTRAPDGANKPDFTPRKARKSQHFWHFKPTKQNLWYFLWWINVDKLSICGSWSIDLNFLQKSSQKWLVFANYFGLPNILPQLPNFFTRIYLSYPWHFPTLIIPPFKIPPVQCRLEPRERRPAVEPGMTPKGLCLAPYWVFMFAPFLLACPQLFKVTCANGIIVVSTIAILWQ